MNYGKALLLAGAALVASTAIGVTVAPVHAGSPRTVVVVGHPDEFVTRRVSYADLNLASAPGERLLNRRVGHAVVGVCNDGSAAWATSSVLRTCKSEAWGRARPQIALAVERARQIASTGASSIAAVTITVAIPQ